MQAVEQQRRVSQQLEDLRAQQKQRTAILRTTGLKFLAALCGACGVLAVAFVILLIVRPDLLARTLDALSGGIAALLMAEEEVKLGLSLIPSSSWLLSGAALVIVLMMGLWVRLMRYPQEV
jgi:acyl-CoA synthetase (AMP-forming)/AMP-acid ligase II